LTRSEHSRIVGAPGTVGPGAIKLSQHLEGPLSERAAARAAERRKGTLGVLASYLLWGIFPLYVRALARLRPLEILVHRMLWSGVLLVVLLTVSGRWAWLRRMREPRVWLTFSASAFLLSCNWFCFLWAVDRGRVVDASLGYFINPFVSVLLGVVLLRERLRRGQVLSLVPAVLGVVWLAVQTGHVPWIGLVLALSFGLYGFLRKTAPLGALEGLTVETLLLSPIALGLFLFWWATGRNGFAASGAGFRLLVMAAGPVTAVPLLLFAAGARRIPLSLTGIIQYVGPTLQLAVGVLVFREPFGPVRIVGFGLVWTALALYTLEGVLFVRRSQRAPL
jgi:chloramphenicol-sensitive protein RarD